MAPEPCEGTDGGRDRPGSGIGREAARLFAGCGASVVLVGRRREPLECLAREIAEQGGACAILPAAYAT